MRGEDSEEEKPRTNTATYTSTVEEHQCARVRVHPNRQKKKSTNNRDQATYMSNAGKAQEGPERRRLASTDSIIGARVEARTWILKKKRRNKTRSNHVVRTMARHGGARFGGRRRPPVHRPSSSSDKNQDRCGASWRNEKGLVRVLSNRAPSYSPLGMRPARAGLGHSSCFQSCISHGPGQREMGPTWSVFILF
jgi:hypothetical protein